MPKTIAEERIKVVALDTPPNNPAAPTVAELTAGTDISCKVLFSDFRLSAVASDTVNEPALCEGGNSAVPGKSNYEGSLTVFRFFDDTGKPVIEGARLHQGGIIHREPHASRSGKPGG